MAEDAALVVKANANRKTFGAKSKKIIGKKQKKTCLKKITPVYTKY